MLKYAGEYYKKCKAVTHYAARAVPTRALHNRATLPHGLDVSGQVRMSRGAEK